MDNDSTPERIVVDASYGYYAYPFELTKTEAPAGSEPPSRYNYGVPLSEIQKKHKKTSQYMNQWMKRRKKQMERRYGSLVDPEKVFAKGRVVGFEDLNEHQRTLIRIEYFPLLEGPFVSSDAKKTNFFTTLLENVSRLKDIGAREVLRLQLEEVIQKVDGVDATRSAVRKRDQLPYFGGDMTRLLKKRKHNDDDCTINDPFIGQRRKRFRIDGYEHPHMCRRVPVMVVDVSLDDPLPSVTGSSMSYTVMDIPSPL